MNDTERFDLLVAGRLDQRTGGYLYDRRIVERLRAGGWQVRVHELDPRFPHCPADALQAAAQTLAGIPAGRVVVIDGLVLGAIADLVERQRERLRLIGLVHHPLALETGLSPDRARTLRHSERRALAAVESVIVTSPSTRRVLVDDYAVPAARISVVIPGTDPAPQAGAGDGQVLRLLCVATLTPRKGHALLVEALAGLRDRPWRLDCAGSTERDRVTSAALREQIAAAGLTDRIHLLGELDQAALDRAYAHADAFVLASYHEGYGMVLAEALARGLPIVATAGGAAAETVPEDAGLLLPPGDGAALRRALARLIDEPDLRVRLAAGAHRARRELPGWSDAAAGFGAVLRGSGRS